MSKARPSIGNKVEFLFDNKTCHLDDFEKEVITNYLTEVEKSSIRTAEVYACILNKFLKFVCKHPVLVVKRDVIEFLQWFDSKKFSDAYNKGTKSVLLKFFAALDDACDMEGIPFKNPVPSSATFKFTRKSIKARGSGQQKLLDEQQIQKLLDFAYEHNRQDYILFLLLARVGIRIEECLSIRIEDIHLEERYLLTGIEPTCQKSSRHLGAALEVPFAPEVGAMLREYIMFLHRENGFLFASNSSQGYVTRPCIEGRIKRVYRKVVGENFTCHWFRHTIITTRKKVFDGEGGRPKINDWESEVIMNHVPDDVENRVYLEKPVEFKRDLYDKYDPFKGLA